MSRTSAMHDLRMAIFPELHERWTKRQISGAHAAGLLGMSERTFRRYVAKYRKFGRKGLVDRRTMGSRSAPPEEVAALVRLYAEGHLGSSVRAFFRVYRDSHGGDRSYTWVKNRLQEARLVTPLRSTRSKGESGGRQPAEGLLLHQASSTREWLPTRIWQLLLVVDDASRRVHSGLFVRSEVIRVRFRTVREIIVANGLFDSIHVDRALRSHHDCQESGQFHRVMRRIGIGVVRSCPRAARARYERVFRVLQQCLPQQMADAGVHSIPEANEFLRSYWAKLNRFFVVQPKQTTSAFTPLLPGYEAEVVETLRSPMALEVGTDSSVWPSGKRTSAQVMRGHRANAGVHGVARANEYRRFSRVSTVKSEWWNHTKVASPVNLESVSRQFLPERDTISS